MPMTGVGLLILFGAVPLSFRVLEEPGQASLM
jgi:hypothetical protein